MRTALFSHFTAPTSHFIERICRRWIYVTFVLAAASISTTGSATPLEIRQQAGGSLERSLVIGEYLYQPQGATISAWQLQAAGAPVLRGLSDAVDGTVTGITVLDEFVYVAWSNRNLAGGLSRFSLDDPAHLRRVEDLPYSTSSFREPGSLVAVGNRLFLADSDAGLFIIDPADPANAVNAINFFGADEMVLEGTRLTTWTRGFLGNLLVNILDVSNPDAPTISSTFDAGAMLRGDVDRNRFAAVGPDGLRIFDTTDPASPAERFHDSNVASLEPLSVHLSGPALYFGVADGLHVWDIANPATAQEVARVAAPSLRTVGAAFLTLDGEPTGIFTTEMGQGLRVDLSDPLTPVFETAWDLPVGADSTAVAVVGGVAYIADFFSGLRTASARHLEQSLGRLDGTGGLNAFADIVVVGTHAFLADWGSGLVIADITDPRAPSQLGHLPLEFAGAVDVMGNTAAVAKATNGGELFIVDVSDVTRPAFLGSATLGQGVDVLFHQGHVLVADEAFGSGGGLRIFDISTPESPRQLGHYSDCGSVRAIAARGDFAFVLCNSGFLDVVNVSQPSAPSRVGRYEDPDFSAGSGIVMSDTQVLAALGRGIKTFDVQDPTNPTLVAALPIASPVRSMTLDNAGSVWVASGFGGLYHLAEPPLFADGFESGDLSAWSAAMP